MMVAIIVGTIFILFFMWLQYSKLKCTKKIDATYLKFNIYNHHGMFSSEKYTILINEKNPRKFIINRRIKIDEILMLLIGLFLLFIGILSLLIS